MESDGWTSEESQKWLETNTGNLAVMTFWPQISACLFNLSLQTSFLSPGPMVRTAALFYSRVWQSLGTTGLCCAVACERSGSREPRKWGSNASHWLGQLRRRRQALQQIEDLRSPVGLPAAGGERRGFLGSSGWQLMREGAAG